jgi:hypothetical protein
METLMTDREQFEALMRERGEDYLYRRDSKFSLHIGEYCRQNVQDQWEIWQAARATAEQPEPDTLPVGKIIANDPVHGWHMQPLIDWEQIGDGTLLYATADQRPSAWKEYAQHLEHCAQCSQMSYADCDEGTRLHDDANSIESQQDAAIESKPAEQSADAQDAARWRYMTTHNATCSVEHMENLIDQLMAEHARALAAIESQRSGDGS